MTDQWLTLSQVAKNLGVHPSTIRSWSDQGRLPVHRTQGGHRRYLMSEVELCMNAQQSSTAPAEADKAVRNAMHRIRVEVGEGRLEAEAWYHKLDVDARDQYRRVSRDLLQGLMTFLNSDEKTGQAEARALGYEYASIGRRCGLSSAEAIHAFLFFRNVLSDSMLSMYESASVRSAHAWGEMLRKMSAFTDQILLTLVETYEAYMRR